jgi:hypothetical protein
MKTKLAFGTILAAALLASLFLLSGSSATADPNAFMPPTMAPSPTPGEAGPVWEATSVPLVEPLRTPAQALAQALVYDVQLATWERPWTLASVVIEPTRFKVTLFSSRGAESADAGRHEWFAPEVEANAGQVWRIEIDGNVQVQVISMNPDSANTTHKGVVYLISQRTGGLLGIFTGEPVK